VAINHTTDYLIHAIVAKGIYVKIVEEDGLIKVALDSTYYYSQDSNSEKDSKFNRTIIFILSGIFAILLAAAIFLFSRL